MPHSLPLSPPKRKTFVRTINLWLSNHWCPPNLQSNWVSSVSSPRKWVQLDARAIWQLAEAAGCIGVTSFMRCTCTSPRNAKGEGLGFLGFLAPGTWHVICLVFATVWFFFTCHGVHGICYIWEHLGMLTFHSAWYLLYSLVLQPLILHGICYVLVVQTFMSVSLGIFRVSFRVSLGCQFRVSFSFFRVSLRFLSNVIRISFRVSLGCHLGYL